MGRHPQYSGLVVAVIGFALTRFTVTLALYDDPVRFYLAGVLPLALGLGLAAFGVGLAVADVNPRLVRTTALWCVVGTSTMLVLVVLTLVGSSPDGMTDFASARSQTYLSNFLIGGSVGGTLTGLYASRNRRQRDRLRQQANRLVVLNRLLRDEVLNAVMAIRGFATAKNVERAETERVIEEHSDAIEATIEEVKYLARETGQGTTAGTPQDLGAAISESVSTVTERHKTSAVAVGTVPDDVAVLANERLSQVFVHLLENAVVHGGDDSPTVEVTTTGSKVRVTVTDEGPGLPESQRAILETGDIAEYDNPETGFGLNIVRLLVESYGGDLETTVDESGTAITVVLPRATDVSATLSATATPGSATGPAFPTLLVTLAAAVVAGVTYGLASIALGGSIAGIGVFYGAPSMTVGWITHQFHSVVFGFMYLSIVTLAPARFRERTLGYVGVGLAWGLVLWVVASGVIAPGLVAVARFRPTASESHVPVLRHARRLGVHARPRHPLGRDPGRTVAQTLRGALSLDRVNLRPDTGRDGKR